MLLHFPNYNNFGLNSKANQQFIKSSISRPIWKIEIATFGAVYDSSEDKADQEIRLKRQLGRFSWSIALEEPFYIPKFVKTELINKHYNVLLPTYFKIYKTRELIIQRYYWLTLLCNIDAYIIDCDIYLTLKIIRHKLYSDLSYAMISTH